MTYRTIYSVLILIYGSTRSARILKEIMSSLAVITKKKKKEKQKLLILKFTFSTAKN